MKAMPDGKRSSGTAAALLLIDVINHFEFPDGPKILRRAQVIARNVVRLKQRARAAGIPAIYVNDNFGDWRSDAARLLAYCLRPAAPGRNFVGKIKPDAEDYFVLKPMHSAFYQTPLDVLLRHLGASSLIFAGLTTNSCILCSVHDANMRDYKIMVAADCCAARTAREHSQALEHIGNMADARVLSSTALRLGKFSPGKPIHESAR
ncbi:MAG TPA: isochorismatase family cysteine hydrolase [Bryobacteraceae bacterium]|jgi:nicotinamidase-related amidase